MMLKAVLTFFLLSFSIHSYSSLITYGDYSHDTDTKVVAGDGLEWLKWSITDNKSYVQALNLANSTYGTGWQLATNQQVSGLVNNFNIGFELDFLNPENVNSSDSVDSNYKNSPYYIFTQMFGYTYLGHEGNLYSDWSKVGTRAIFGSIVDSANMLEVWSYGNITNIDCCNFQQTAAVALDVDQNYLNNWSYYRDSVGVALVRVVDDSVTIPVPSPPTFGIFLLSIVAILMHKARSIA